METSVKMQEVQKVTTGSAKISVKEVHMLNFEKYINPNFLYFFLDIP
jgi:hypothetical protein